MAAENVQIVVVDVPPEMAREQETDAWLGLGVALAMLLVVAAYSRRRARQVGGESPPRLLRISFAAAGPAAALMLWLVAGYLRRPYGGDDLLSLAIVGAGVGVFMIIGLVLFGIADFWLGLRRPHRSRGWLVAAILSFGLLVASCFLIAAWLQGVPARLVPETLHMIVVGAIAGTLWWAYLPTGGDQGMADVFE